MGEIIFYVVIGLIVIRFVYKYFIRRTPEEIEAYKALEESLADEFIYDPETGSRITLEEAESGHWIAHNNLNRIKSEEEIEKHYHGKEKEAQVLINLMVSKGYQSQKLSYAQIEFLENSQILSKYDSWSYSNAFSFNNGRDFVFLPAVNYIGNKHHEGYHESQIMLWIKSDRLNGHVYAREKTSFEALTDLVRNDDIIKLDNYETFVLKMPMNFIYLNKILQSFDTEKDLEIEIIDNHLLIKTMKFANIEDFTRVENIIKNFNP